MLLKWLIREGNRKMTLKEVLQTIDGYTEVQLDRFNKTQMDTRIFKGRRNDLFHKVLVEKRFKRLGENKIHSISPLWTKDSAGIRITIEH